MNAPSGGADAPRKLEGETWRAAMLERCDAIDRRIVAVIERIDAIYAKLRAFKPREGAP